MTLQIFSVNDHKIRLCNGQPKKKLTYRIGDKKKTVRRLTDVSENASGDFFRAKLLSSRKQKILRLKAVRWRCAWKRLVRNWIQMFFVIVLLDKATFIRKMGRTSNERLRCLELDVVHVASQPGFPPTRSSPIKKLCRRRKIL